MSLTNLEGQEKGINAFASILDKPDVFVKKAYFKAPNLGTDVAILAATALADGEETIVTSGDFAHPDVPRALVIAGTNGTETGTVTIDGWDYLNNFIVEEFTLDGTNSVNGEKAFKAIRQIVLPKQANASDEVKIGVQDKLGLKEVVKEGVVLIAFADGTEEATKPVITKDSTDISKNLILFNTALDGSTNFTCYFLDK